MDFSLKLQQRPGTGTSDSFSEQIDRSQGKKKPSTSSISHFLVHRNRSTARHLNLSATQRSRTTRGRGCDRQHDHPCQKSNAYQKRKRLAGRSNSAKSVIWTVRETAETISNQTILVRIEQKHKAELYFILDQHTRQRRKVKFEESNFIFFS